MTSIVVLKAIFSSQNFCEKFKNAEYHLAMCFIICFGLENEIDIDGQIYYAHVGGESFKTLYTENAGRYYSNYILEFFRLMAFVVKQGSGIECWSGTHSR